MVRGRWEYPALYELAHAHRKLWNAQLVLIEETSSGIPLTQHLRRDIRTATRPRHDPPWRVVGYTPRVAKEVRLATQTVRFEQGEFQFPAQAPFMDELKREMVMFGHSKHDDQVDSIAQFVAWARASSGPRALRSAAEKKARAGGRRSNSAPS